MKTIAKIRNLTSLFLGVVGIYAEQNRYFFIPMVILVFLLALIACLLSVSAPLAPILYPMF